MGVGVGDRWIKLGDWELGGFAKTVLCIWPKVLLFFLIMHTTSLLGPATA